MCPGVNASVEQVRSWATWSRKSRVEKTGEPQQTIYFPIGRFTALICLMSLSFVGECLRYPHFGLERCTSEDEQEFFQAAPEGDPAKEWLATGFG